MRGPRQATLTFFLGSMLVAVLGAEACTSDDSDNPGLDAGLETGLPSVDASVSSDAVSPVADAALTDSAVTDTDSAVADSAADVTVVLNDGAAPFQDLVGLENPSSLAIDAQFLYVATDRGIYRLAKDGSTSDRLSVDEKTHRLWKDGSRIFFSTFTGEVKVVAANAAPGGGGVSLVVAVDGGPVPIRTANGSVYFGMYNANSGNEIWAVEEDGGGLRTFANGVRAYDFAIANGAVYAGGKPDATVVEMPLGGGPRVSRAQATGLLSDFTTRDGYVYFSTRGGDLTRIPVDGGAAEEVVNGGDKIAGIVVDDANVYYVSYESGSATGLVRRVPKTGGTPVTLASAQRSAFAIALDETHVYWTSLLDDGGVKRVPK